MSKLPSFLTYSSDTQPGLSRIVRGKGFSYHTVDGAKVEDAPTLARIAGLGLPPAYREVWICATDHGHLQATGRDEAGRKQYRYHEKWRDWRDRLKYAALTDFGAALPALRARVRRDLGRESPDKAFVCAALVRLIDRASLRVGSQDYTDSNGSFGATTLLSRHVKITDGGVKLDYKAKGGKRVRKQLSDRKLHQVLQAIDDLPGREMFCWLDEDGEARGIDSADVNAYLAETLEGDFTAKSFRTWRGSVEAFAHACEAVDAGEAVTIKAMSERAAEALHNTAAICRSSYIHPDIVALGETEAPGKAIKACRGERLDGLRVAEAEMLSFLG